MIVIGFVIVIEILLFVKNEANPVHLVRLGEWDVTNEGEDCVGNRCLPPVQDFNVTLADFTIHPDYSADFIRQKTVVNDIGECELSYFPLKSPSRSEIHA